MEADLEVYVVTIKSMRNTEYNRTLHASECILPS